jgi:hypothetical protein
MSALKKAHVINRDKRPNYCYGVTVSLIKHVNGVYECVTTDMVKYKKGRAHDRAVNEKKESIKAWKEFVKKWPEKAKHIIENAPWLYYAGAFKRLKY